LLFCFRSRLFLPYKISHHLFIYSFISSIIYTLIYSFGAIYLLIHFHDHFLFVTIPYSSPPMCLFIYPLFPFTFSLLFISNFHTITSSSSIPHFLLLIPPSHFPFFCHINLIAKIFSCFSSSLFPRQATCCLFFLLGLTFSLGHAVAQLVEAIPYKTESRGFRSRLCHWNFSST